MYVYACVMISESLRKRRKKKIKCKATTGLTVFVYQTVFCCLAVPFITFLSWPPTVSLPPQFGRTEVIDNTLNPDFVRKYILDYFFEEKQNLRFDLWVISFEVVSALYLLSCPLSIFFVMNSLSLRSVLIESPAITVLRNRPFGKPAPEQPIAQS